MVSKDFQGFTLVEMMVSVVISAIIMAAAYQVLVGQSRVYEAQEQTIDMQQDVRAALDFICRELRMAGYGVDAGTSVFSSLVNNDTADPNVDDGTDAITFVGNTDYGSLVVNNAPAGTNTVNVFPAPAQTMEFEVGDVVDILDGQRLLLDSGLPITGCVLGDPDDPTSSPTKLTLSSNFTFDVPAGGYVTIQPQTISYQVNNNILKRNGLQDLIENVEDLQFVYAFDYDVDSDNDSIPDSGDMEIDTDAAGEIIWAVDTDGDGFLDSQVLGDGSYVDLTTLQVPGTSLYRAVVPVNGFPITPADPAACPIRAVRVNILVRSSRENPDPRFRNQNLPAEFALIEDHDRTGLGIQDGFRRRLLTSVVKFRNLGLNIE